MAVVTFLALLFGFALANVARAVTIIDWTGKTFTQDSPNCDGYVQTISANDMDVRGGRFIGNALESTDWRECKGPNGYGIGDRGSGNGKYTGQFMDNIGTDGWRVSSEAHDSIVWNRVQTVHIRDDVFSIGRKSGAKFTVLNSYVEGYAIWASRNTGGDNNPYSLTMDGVIARQKIYTIGDTGRRCGNMFKLDNARGDSSHPWLIQNSVFLVPDDACGMDTPNATWRNVTFVWTGSGSFPYWSGGSSAPNGVTITTNVSVFNNAVTAWENSGGATPSPTTSPTISPSPSPSPTTTTPGTTTFGTAKDAYVDSASSGTNHGSDSTMVVDDDGAGNRRRGILNFDPTGLIGRPVVSAKVRLYAVEGTSGTGGNLRNLGNAAWEENTVTYTNQPSLVETTTLITSRTNIATNTWVEWDVTSLIQQSLDDAVSFRLDPTSGDAVEYASKENATAANRPQLVVGIAGGTSPPPTTATPTPTSTATSVTVAAAGDIVCQAGNPGSDDCRDADTGAKVIAMNPTKVLGLGDLQYEDGSLTQYNAAYASSPWGGVSIKPKTLPVPGNHEHNTTDAAGYYDYWNGSGQNTGIAGTRGKGWHSTNVGAWLIIGLDSDHPVYENTVDAEQLTWFQARLMENRQAPTPKPVLVFWHHPRWTAGGDHGNEQALDAYWRAMVSDPYVEVELHGHVHKEEWLGRLNATGQRSATGVASFGLGTGGKNLDQTPKTFTTEIQAISENLGTGGDFGVGKFQLFSDGHVKYDFVSTETTNVYTNSVDLTPRGNYDPNATQSPGPSPSQTTTPVPTTTTVPGTATFGSDGDSFVRSDSTTRNFGTEGVVSVQGTAPARRAFIRFDPNGLSGKTITKATMRLKVADASDYSGGVKKVTPNDSWTETGLTWTNQPATVSAATVESETDTTATLNEWVTFDVTQFLELNPDDPFSLRITHNGGDILKYASREAVDASARPQLVVNYTVTTPTTVPSTIVVTPSPTGTGTPTPPTEQEILSTAYARQGEALDPEGDYTFRDGTSMVYIVLRAQASAAQAAWLKGQLLDNNGNPATVVFSHGAPTVAWWDYHLALDDVDVRAVVFDGRGWNRP